MPRCPDSITPDSTRVRQEHIGVSLKEAILVESETINFLEEVLQP